jgi:5,10-methylenetetrahydromethanopterin reductase
MDFAVGIGRTESIHEVGDHAKVAEESGFKYVSVVDIPYLGREVDSMMTMAALSTKKVMIGQGVTDPVTRHPLVSANASATIDELSNGRAFVGIGTGGPWGKPMKKPARLSQLREAVTFIKSYTAGKEVEWQGVKFQSEWSRRELPVYIACGGPKACFLAGQVADGVIATSNADLATNKWRMDQIARGAESVGRDPADIDYWVRGMIYVTDDKDKATREVAGYAVNGAYLLWVQMQQNTPASEELRIRLEKEQPGLLDDCKKVGEAFDPKWVEHPDAPAAKFITRRIIDSQHAVGTPDQICEQLSKLEEAGMKTFGTVTYTIDDKRDMMREIGSTIISRMSNS